MVTGIVHALPLVLGKGPGSNLLSERSGWMDGWIMSTGVTDYPSAAGIPLNGRRGVRKHFQVCNCPECQVWATEMRFGTGAFKLSLRRKCRINQTVLDLITTVQDSSASNRSLTIRGDYIFRSAHRGRWRWWRTSGRAVFLELTSVIGHFENSKLVLEENSFAMGENNATLDTDGGAWLVET